MWRLVTAAILSRCIETVRTLSLASGVCLSCFSLLVFSRTTHPLSIYLSIHLFPLSLFSFPPYTCPTVSGEVRDPQHQMLLKEVVSGGSPRDLGLSVVERARPDDHRQAHASKTCHGCLQLCTLSRASASARGALGQFGVDSQICRGMRPTGQ